jgi:hypothetical protein
MIIPWVLIAFVFGIFLLAGWAVCAAGGRADDRMEDMFDRELTGKN